MPKIVYESIEFDSQEEVEFYQWVLEAMRVGLVTECYYHEETLPLFEKTLYNGKSFLQQHVYTYDFKLKVQPEFVDWFEKKWCDNNGYVYIDVKGTWNRHGGDREFSINRKWVWEKHGIFIAKIVPEKWFMKTWCPKECRLSPKQNKVREKYQNCKSVNSFIEKYFIQGEIW